VTSGHYAINRYDFDDAVVRRSIPDWPAWAAFERAWRSSERLIQFRRRTRDVAHRFERRLMTDSPLNPIVLGRQRHESNATAAPF
jgi:hypothetical protein